MSGLWDMNSTLENVSEKRQHYFSMISPKDNWKMPIDAWIDVNDFDNCNSAAIWYTGGPLKMGTVTPDGMAHVYGEGYYLNIGA